MIRYSAVVVVVVVVVIVVVACIGTALADGGRNRELGAAEALAEKPDS